ncbi:2-oxoacid:acceptor oxidoreductase family protein [Desulfoferrobacter suflitae]|uniref:2-oxoacid:acceptor oxidoreductase family protein n=1 Tax=Desulfoferrobacter suflitae TaxID=2865782 RepID=UPI00216409F1|nr:2-oxoacid:acceptor oxidoreductase family protein [Desulfoferrobacter suflitae]MCK8601535.1 2-oxoacid:acceptor oxidoreductase family protein [Desulfoferrobacter suflitae]
MLEIRFHGRGGQGTVVATILLAKAFFRAGYYVQSFPLFGVERRGAPVEAYLRLDEDHIWVRTNVYQPDHVVVMDKTLLQGIDVTMGLKPGGWILINTSSIPPNSEQFSRYRLAVVDATRIALRHRLGTRTHPIVNTAMMGALARMLEMPPLEAISKAVEEEIPVRPEQNIQAAKDAYDEVQLVGLTGPELQSSAG